MGTSILSRLTDYAARWGVLVGEPTPGNVATHFGPSDWSIEQWATAPRIVCTRPWGQRESDWPYLLHELAHAVCPTAPDNCDEIEETMGFEILSVLHLGLSFADWQAWQDNFGLNMRVGAVYVEDWTEAPPMWRRSKMIAACDEARARGHFVGGEPSFWLYRLVGGKPVELATRRAA